MFLMKNNKISQNICNIFVKKDKIMENLVDFLCESWYCIGIILCYKEVSA